MAESATLQAPPGGPPGLGANRNWRLLWAGQAVSLTGDMVFYMTVLLWTATIIAKGKPWAPAAASGALIATAAPVLIIGPLAGVFVDRWDRRRTMLAADAARCALIACLLIIPALRHAIPVGAQLGILYAVLAVCSCFAEFFNPARLAILGAVVPSEQHAKASGQLAAASSLAQIIGLPVAAPLLFTLGVQWALIVNAASFAVSFACVRAIKTVPGPVPEAPPRASFAAEFRTGITFFARNRILVTLLLGIVIAMLGNGAVNSLAVFFVPHNLHVSASWLGTVLGAFGAGAIAGALLTARVTRWVRPQQLFWISMLVCGLTMIGLSRCTALGPALIVFLLLGVGAGVFNSCTYPVILSTTPAYMIGRVSAVFSPLQQLAAIVSIALAGTLASTVLRNFHHVVLGVHLGPYDTVFATGGLLIVLAAAASIAPMRTRTTTTTTAPPTTVPAPDTAPPTNTAPATDPA